MDKLRALQYFVAAAEEGSFSAAARRLEVSMPAVLKLVNALERDLGASLLDRQVRGVLLTADGARYLERCRTVLQDLADAAESVGGAAARLRGTIVVGATDFVARRCLGPSLPQFHARFPDIELDFRLMHNLNDTPLPPADVYVLHTFGESADLIEKPLGQGRYRIVASPRYWSAHGLPQRPKDLEGHNCLVFRAGPTLLDVWEFGHGQETESARVRGWLTSTQRELLLDAALAGEGVIRATDLALEPHLRQGHLVPALNDWTPKHPPPYKLFMRQQHRRTPRIRHFVDFVTTAFRRLEADAHVPGFAAQVPAWWGKRPSRVSRAPPRA